MARRKKNLKIDPKFLGRRIYEKKIGFSIEVKEGNEKLLKLLKTNVFLVEEEKENEGNKEGSSK